MSSTQGLFLGPNVWDKAAVKENHPGYPDYPDLHVVNPQNNNTHKSTLILLHGTSTDGPSFASSILHCRFPGDVELSYNDLHRDSLVQRLPNTRFVFPTGKLRPTTVFGGRMSNAWFDIHDFTNRTIGEKESAVGIRESLGFLEELVRYEQERLTDPYSNVALKEGEVRKYGKIAIGGFSQGAAMALIAVLSQEVSVDACCCLSGWLPFRNQISEAMVPYELRGAELLGYSKKVAEGVANTIRGLLGAPRGIKMLGTEDRVEYLEGRFFFAHGKADTKVKYEWGVHARDTVSALGADYVHRTEGSNPPISNPFSKILTAWTAKTREVSKTDELKVTWMEVDGLKHEISSEGMLALADFLDDPKILSGEMEPEIDEIDV